ncbi:hypothetical protein, partial [Mesorhizobium sp. M2E.F.Ca.ET.154.01.1.1]|uniref:hypothetical protein n=1 Tax=Mesorhizobium sp. M2E.F.Ca.ET.154.01.1.1 TaxID=2500521 RepID=UPI001673D602
CLALLLGEHGHLRGFPQLLGFSRSTLEPPLKPVEPGSLDRLSNERREGRVFGVDRALEMIRHRDGGLLALPCRPLRSRVPSDYIFPGTLFTAASEVAQP